MDRIDALPDVAGIDVWTNARFRPQFERWAAARATRTPLRVLSNEIDRPEHSRGAVGDIAAYLEHECVDHPLLVLGGDNVCDFDLTPLARVARTEVGVVVHDVGSTDAVSRLASVEVDADLRVVRLREKDPRPASTLGATALYAVPADAVDEVAVYLRAGGSPDSMGSLLEWWVPRRPVRALRLEGRWIDVGTPADLERARSWFAARRPLQASAPTRYPPGSTPR